MSSDTYKRSLRNKSTCRQVGTSRKLACWAPPPWYVRLVPVAQPSSHARHAIAVMIAIATLSGCGGGTRQDVGEPFGTYTVAVPAASFAPSQQIAQSYVMRISVMNSDTKSIPNVAVTVDSFDYISQQPDLANPHRPVWGVDQEPVGGAASYVNTWALGRLLPGHTATFIWRVTALRAGSYTLHYRVAAGLNGKAVAQLAGGGVPGGTFNVQVSGRPEQASVNPNTGQVIRSPAPPPSAPVSPSAQSFGGPNVPH